MVIRKKVTLYFCAAIVGVTGSCASLSQKGEPVMDSITYHELQKMKEGIARQSMTDGEVFGITVGGSKRLTVAHLREIGIAYLKLDVKEKIRVSDPKDLVRLQDAGAIILFPGDARFRFYGDKIHDREVLPSINTAWRQRLEMAAVRGEVLTVFAEMLVADKRFVVGNYVPEGSWIDLGSLTPEIWPLLEKYDVWVVGYSNDDGLWDLKLNFENDRLNEIMIHHSPVDIP